MEDKLYLENINEYVFDVEKIVTYKWLAMTLSVPFSEATRMLSEFVQQQQRSATPPQPIHVTYLITGVSRDENANKKMIVSLADGDELEELKTKLDTVISAIVYSVQKGDHLEDRSSLYTAERDLLLENLHNFSNSCTVRYTVSAVKEEIVDHKAPSLPMKKEDQHVKPDEQVDKPVQQAKVKLASSKGKGPAKPKGVAAMFTSKQPKKATSDPDKPPHKQEEVEKPPVKETIPKASNNKVKKLTGSAKSSMGIIPNLDKDVFATEDDDDVVVLKDEDHKRCATSNPVTSPAGKDEKKGGKNIKRRRVCQELSSEDSDDDTTGANTDPSSVTPVSAGGTKKRKIVRRLVDKMYIDDDGSMVTEKEWQEISTDDDSELVVATNDKKIMVATSNKTKTVKAKSKQSSLSDFFRKK